jgi:hypothetical protein
MSQCEGLVGHECSAPEGFVSHEWEADRCLRFNSMLGIVNVVGHL